MSSMTHDSQKPAPPQGVQWNEHDWQDLLKRLPSDWEAQAVQLKAWQRLRKLASVADLLRALLVYAACGYSFRQLGLWATLVGVGCLSERAWRKRVERAQEWIRWVLGALIGSQQSPEWLPQRSGRILLVDGSRLKTPAGSGEDVKVHSAYELGAGRLAEVRVADRHSGEGLHHFALRPGDVVVTDAGYQLGASVQQGQAQGAFGVHRISNHQVRLEREDGQKIDLKRLIKHQKYGTVTQYQVWVWDPTHTQRFAIRLVIALLPRKQAMQARARKQERIRHKKGSKANLAPAWWAIVWSLQEQEAQDLSELLAGLLSEPEVGLVQEAKEQEEEQPTWVISHWGLARCELETLRMVLRGSWTRQRLHHCLPQVRRYLVSRQRAKRISQETEMRQWLLQQLAQLEKEPLVA